MVHVIFNCPLADRQVFHCFLFCQPFPLRFFVLSFHCLIFHYINNCKSRFISICNFTSQKCSRVLILRDKTVPAISRPNENVSRNKVSRLHEPSLFLAFQFNFSLNCSFCMISSFTRSSTLYIFRCPEDAVFSHKQIKPKFIENTRPDRQDAWFSHVGWGHAKNQLASYLVCGVRLKPGILKLFDSNYAKHLFPSRAEDLVLNSFLDIIGNPKYKGEVRRALKKIYVLKD